jgi:hypothetical protein
MERVPVAKARDFFAIARNFDQLPDGAVIPDCAAAIVLGMSIWTLRRANPTPQIALSPRSRGRRVGDIRKAIRRAADATAMPTDNTNLEIRP